MIIPYKWYYLCPKRWSQCPNKQDYYKIPKSTPPMSQGLLTNRQDVTSPKLWRGISKLPSFSLTQPIQALRRSSDTPREIKLNVLYRGHEAFDQSPAALTVTLFTGLHRSAERSCIEHRSLATCNTKSHPEMGSEENGRKSVQWSRKPHLVKTQTRILEARSWGLRGWARVMAVTESRKALWGIISGHGWLKEI